MIKTFEACIIFFMQMSAKSESTKSVIISKDRVINRFEYKNQNLRKEVGLTWPCPGDKSDRQAELKSYLDERMLLLSCLN